MLGVRYWIYSLNSKVKTATFTKERKGKRRQGVEGALKIKWTQEISLSSWGWEMVESG